MKSLHQYYRFYRIISPRKTDENINSLENLRLRRGAIFYNRKEHLPFHNMNPQYENNA